MIKFINSLNKLKLYDIVLRKVEAKKRIDLKQGSLGALAR